MAVWFYGLNIDSPGDTTTSSAGDGAAAVGEALGIGAGVIPAVGSATATGDASDTDAYAIFAAVGVAAATTTVNAAVSTPAYNWPALRMRIMFDWRRRRRNHFCKVMQ